MGILREADVRSYTALDDTAGLKVGTWYTYSLPGMYGSGVGWTKQPEAYIEFEVDTLPGQVISLIHFKNTNGGIGGVTINGEPALANLLPEFEGNRIVDFYHQSGPTPNLFKNSRKVIPVASDLPAGRHVVRVHYLGLKNELSSDTRILVDGVAVYNGEALAEDTVAGEFLVAGSTQLSAPGAWENVFKYESEFYGTNQHGGEIIYQALLKGDGSPINLQLYDSMTLQKLEYLQTSLISVPKMGPAASQARHYTFTGAGLDLWQSTAFTRAMMISNTYGAMWPILDGPEISDAGWIYARDGGRHHFDLTLNDRIFKGGINARAVRLYNSSNPRTFDLELSQCDPNVENERMWLWDLGAPSYNKIYFQRQSNFYTTRQNERWATMAKYRYSYVVPEG